MKSIFIIGAIAILLLVTYSIADISYPYLNDQGNYFSLNFGFKNATNRINSRKYHFLYNDCTKEYAIETGNAQYLLVWRDIYGGCYALQSVLLEDATKFKDTTSAKRWLWVYDYYEHKKDSSDNADVDEYIKEYKDEQAEKRKHIDSCRDIFKPLTQ